MNCFLQPRSWPVEPRKAGPQRSIWDGCRPGGSNPGRTTVGVAPQNRAEGPIRHDQRSEKNRREVHGISHRKPVEPDRERPSPKPVDPGRERPSPKPVDPGRERPSPKPVEPASERSERLSRNQLRQDPHPFPTPSPSPCARNAEEKRFNGRVQRVCATTVSGGVLCGWMSGVVG